MSILLISIAAPLLLSVPQAQIGRFIVTVTPLDTGGRVPLCLGVEPGNAAGVWWWEPVDADCSRRSTGPGVFSPENVQVTPTAASGEITARFRLQLRTAAGSSSPTSRDVVVAIRNGEIRADSTGAIVKTTRRNDLNIPER